jgi:ferritin
MVLNKVETVLNKQIEFEALMRRILDKLKLIGNGNGKGGMYLFDRDLPYISVSAAADRVTK